MKDYEELEVQYAPMISAIIRNLHIYRDYESFRQIGKIALWQASVRFNDSKGNFTAFAYRSISGAMIDELKRETKFTERNLVQENHEFDEFFADDTEDSMPEWLDMISLSNEERKMLEALFLKGESVVGLAAAEGISVAGMKKRRERLLKKVKKKITDG